MKLILDTNCYISFLNQRNQEQYIKMSSLWEKISKLEIEIFLTSHNITEIVFVLRSIYSVDPRKIQQIIEDLLVNPGVHFKPAYFPDLILEFWPKYIKDYGYAVLAAASKSLEAQIVTFDRNFNKELKKLNIPTYSV